jgi:pyrrolidone-carboxylate peptidase
LNSGTRPKAETTMKRDFEGISTRNPDDQLVAGDERANDLPAGTPRSKESVGNDINDPIDAAAAIATALRQQFENRASGESSISFLITGFGPFRGVRDNPTSILVRDLIPFLQEKENQSATVVPLSKITEATVMETSAIYTRTFLGELHRRLEGTTETAEKKRNGQDTEFEEGAKPLVVVLLHLGVDDGGKCFALEQCGYNNATFRVPDERSYNPFGVKISAPIGDVCEMEHDSDLASDIGLDECLYSTLPVTELVSKLNSTSTHRVSNDARTPHAVVSVDPGRFVCNYAYFYSLLRFRSGGKNPESSNVTVQTNPASPALPVHSSSQSGRQDPSGIRYHSLFLHVPPFSVAPKEVQLDFIHRLLVLIHNTLSGEDGDLGV